MHETDLPVQIKHQYDTLLRQSAEFDARAFAAESPGHARLARSLSMLAIAFARAWTSGQAALADVAHERATLPGKDIVTTVTDLAVLDVISCLTVADMVMDDAAIVILRAVLRMQPSDSAPVVPADAKGRSKPSLDVAPWQQLVDLVDGGRTAGDWQPTRDLVRLVRVMDLRLYEARNRLVAHRQADHVLGITWHSDGPTLHVFGPDLARGLGFLLDALHELDGKATMPDEISWDAYRQVRDDLLGRAGELTAKSRKEVVKAMRAAGYDQPALRLTVWWLRELADAALAIDG